MIEFDEIAEDPFLRMLLSIFIANVLAMAGVILFCCFLVDSRCLWIDWIIESSSVWLFDALECLIVFSACLIDSVSIYAESWIGFSKDWILMFEAFFILSHIWFFAYSSLVTASSRWIFDQNSREILRKVELLTHSLRSLVRRTRFARSHRLDCNNYLGTHFLKGGTIIFIIFWFSHFGALV